MLEVNNLTKVFGSKKILDNVSFNFLDNKVTSVIGPNGSGKTTLFRCLVDIYNYGGSIKYNGLELKNNKSIIKPKICFIPDNDNESIDLTVKEFILLTSGLYNSQVDLKKFKLLVGLYDIDGYLNKMVKECSHGTIKKINLIIGFLTEVKTLFLDEPFNGLDPEYSIITKQFFQIFLQKGYTFIISNHNLSIVEEISDNLLLIKDGKVFFSGGLVDFKNNYKVSNLEENWLKILDIKSNSQNDLQKLFELYKN